MIIIGLSAIVKEKGDILKFILYSLGRILSERILPLLQDYETVSCPSPQRLSLIRIDKNDVILMDASAAKLSLIERFGREIRIILFHEDDTIPGSSDGMTIPVRKGCSDEELSIIIRKMADSDQISYSLQHSLAGSSEIMRMTRKQLHMAIKSTLPVHIVGETGTGKTLAAKLIHTLSQGDSRLVMESCGCLATDIADSELFGHIKGAFSGAYDNREGLLAEANGSTLFLDEIQDLPLNIQIKLLRVLDSGEYRKLGSDLIMKTSFRLITASNMPLASLLAEKRIRKDFYYRISGMEIRMPSLDEHPEDIPELLEVFRRNKHEEIRHIPDMSYFMHSFPGNVRELFKEAELYLQGIRH